MAITFERALNYLIVISLPISIGTIALADKIIMIFKPEYLEAVLPLQIIMAALPFIFLNFPIGSLLNGCDRQKINTRNMALTLAASILLNISLIPKYQAIGASITVLATNALMFALGAFQVRQIVKIKTKSIIMLFVKVFCSALIMGAAVFALKNSWPILVLIPSGALIFAAISFALGAIKLADIKSILNTAKKA